VFVAGCRTQALNLDRGLGRIGVTTIRVRLEIYVKMHEALQHRKVQFVVLLQLSTLP